MENPKDQSAVMRNRLEEREREQLQILSVCKALSEASTQKDFHNVITGLKQHFLFEDFILGAAVLLGLPGTTLISRMQKLGIKKEHFLS